MTVSEPLATPAPGEGSTSGGTGPDRPGRTGTLVALAVALVAVVSTLILVVKWNGERATNHNRAVVAAQSGRFAEQFLTLDSRDPSRTEKAVVALATGSFRRTFRQGFEAGLVQALVAVGQVQTEATVKEVFLGDLDGRSAHAIVHVGVVVHPIDRPTVTSARPDSWIELDLVKQGGTWLVDGVGDLKFGTSEADPGSAATTTTTH